MLDSYLIMAETLGLHAIILLNKTDLACEALKEQLLSNYQSLNYYIAMINKENTEALK